MVVLMLVSALCGAVYQTEGCCCISFFCDLVDEADEMADALANLCIGGYNIGVRRNGSRSRRIQGKNNNQNNGFNPLEYKEVSVKDLSVCITKDNNECSICTEIFLNIAAKHLGKNGKVVKAKCGHMYHEQCLRLWLVDYKNTTCPMCREVLVKS